MLRNYSLAITALICLTTSWLQAAEWETSKVAQTKAADWLRKRDGKIALEYKAAEKTEGFAGAAISGSPDTMYTLNRDGWSVTIGLQGKLQPDDTAASLQKRLKFIALDRVPTPGLEVKGWEIKPRTAVSSFRDGVEIRSYKNGIATISVKTSCFCLSGMVRQELLGPQPADAGLPEGTYFQLRQAIPLEIVFEAPLSFAP